MTGIVKETGLENEVQKDLFTQAVDKVLRLAPMERSSPAAAVHYR